MSDHECLTYHHAELFVTPMPVNGAKVLKDLPS